MAMMKRRPGYTSRRRADGSIAHYWNPKAPNQAPDGMPVKPISDDATDAVIVKLCRRWTEELLVDLNVDREGSEPDALPMTGRWVP